MQEMFVELPEDYDPDLDLSGITDNVDDEELVLIHRLEDEFGVDVHTVDKPTQDAA